MNSLKALLFVPVAALASSLSAQVALENFGSYSLGNNLTTPLGGGSGWSGNWTAAASAGTLSASGVVSNASPFGDAGQYLDVDLSSTTAGASLGIGRQLASGAPAGSYTVSFQWRADVVGAGFSAGNDRFEFFSANSAATVHSASTSPTATLNSPYLMGVFGTNRGSSTALNFAVYNPVTPGDAFDANRHFNLGSVATGGAGTTMNLAAGTTYSFSISVDTLSQTWAVSVSNGVGAVSSSGLKWWGTQTQPFVAFGARGDAANEVRSFSVDNVQVAAVPEPAGAALLMASGVAAPVMMRRRRR